VLGHANQRDAVLFRDYLRQDRVSTQAYAKVKFVLARLHPDDMDAYYDVKDLVCDIIMAGAERWAAATGYTQPETDPRRMLETLEPYPALTTLSYAVRWESETMELRNISSDDLALYEQLLCDTVVYGGTGWSLASRRA
jgi:hypothetical protein